MLKHLAIAAALGIKAPEPVQERVPVWPWPQPAAPQAPGLAPEPQPEQEPP